MKDKTPSTDTQISQAKRVPKEKIGNPTTRNQAGVSLRTEAGSTAREQQQPEASTSYLAPFWLRTSS